MYLLLSAFWFSLHSFLFVVCFQNRKSFVFQNKKKQLTELICNRNWKHTIVFFKIVPLIMCKHYPTANLSVKHWVVWSLDDVQAPSHWQMSNHTPQESFIFLIQSTLFDFSHFSFLLFRFFYPLTMYFEMFIYNTCFYQTLHFIYRWYMYCEFAHIQYHFRHGTLHFLCFFCVHKWKLQQT